MKIARSPEDLERLLEEQLTFIEASAESFDSGFEGEAKRLATTIRVLCHDTVDKNGKPISLSLLAQLGRKGTTRFPDTSELCTPPVSEPYAGLVRITQDFDKGSWYVAPLDQEGAKEPPPLRDFDEWWNGAIFVFPSDKLLSRRWLVTVAANQDGGAHVDPALDERYRHIFSGLGWESTFDEAPQKLNQIELVSLRQVAHEALKALRPGYEKKQTNIGLVISSMIKTYVHGDTSGMPGFRPMMRISRPDGTSVTAAGPMLAASSTKQTEAASIENREPMTTGASGPFVVAAVFCERVLNEKDDVVSLIRIVDYASEDAIVPVPMSDELSQQFQMRPFLTNFFFYVSAFPDAPGTHEICIRFVYEDGTTMPDCVTSIDFPNATDGRNLTLRLASPFPKAGRLWAEVWIDKIFKTKSSLMLRRSLQTKTPERP